MSLIKFKLTEKLSLQLLTIGAAILVSSFFFFFWNEWNHISVTNSINAGKVGQFGDFIGGVIGSIWALAGVIMFYVALKDQRMDFGTNSKILIQQVEEFKAQKLELEETRKLIKLQSETLNKQQFESTFFNLVNLHHELISTMSNHSQKGRDCFKHMDRLIYDRYANHHHVKPIHSESVRFEKAKESFTNIYNQSKSELGPYFRNLFNIYKFLDKSEIKDKETYASILSDQLSEIELNLIFYNGLPVNEFMTLINKYQILSNLDLSKIICKPTIDILPYEPKAFGLEEQ